MGSAFAAEHYQTNFLIIKGETHILVDFGMTGPQALLHTAGLRATDIEVVLSTHSHTDHVGGIKYLALMNRYVGQCFMKKPKLRIITADEYQRVLWDCTLRGGLEWNEETEDTGQKLFFGDFFEVDKPQRKAGQPREIFEINFE